MNTRASSGIAALITTLVIGLLAVAAQPAQAAGRSGGGSDPFVRLTASATTESGGALLSYDLRCPAGGNAFLAASLTQRADGRILQRRGFVELECTGRPQRAQLEVLAVAGDPLLGRGALVETDLDFGRDIGSWYANEFARARVDGTRAPVRRQHDGVLTWSTPVDRVVEPDVRAIDARRVLGGAGVEMTYVAQCTRGEMVFVISEIEQGTAAVSRPRVRRSLPPAAARGGRLVECSGRPQLIRAIVATTPPNPLRFGEADMRTELTNGCPDEFSCFSSFDERSLFIR